jgi:hypothetical protein
MSNTYSFLDVSATLIGPGGAIGLGNGSASSEEGITIEPTGDISGLQIGADGAGVHSLYADKSGTITVHLLKNSPVNRLLSAMYAFQTASGTQHGQNTISVNDKNRGDVIVATQCAFKKAPPIKYAKDADVIAWEFAAVKIERTLGA